MEEMALWGILEIPAQEERLGYLDLKVMKDDEDLATRDQEDLLETEGNQAGEDQEGPEVNVEPKENLEVMDHQESLGKQDRQGRLEREDRGEMLELLGIPDQQEILGSPSVTS